MSASKNHDPGGAGAPERSAADRAEQVTVFRDRLELERIARDEATLGSCRYAGTCKAVRVRNDVLSIVAHDLRVSLNLISASAELARDLPFQKAQVDERMDLIIDTVGRMNRLIQDLLEVSKIEAGKLALDRRPTGVARLLEEAAHLLEPAAQEAGIDLRFEETGTSHAVEVDPDRIIQVLANLIGNALRFTPGGGQVRVRAAMDSDPRWVRFSVIDTGMGIPRDNLDHLFDRFWQADAAHQAGTGLGLVIVKGIVEQHGGSITVESEPGIGSSFHFTLPTATEA